jgi:hypothetical protein
MFVASTTILLGGLGRYDRRGRLSLVRGRLCLEQREHDAATRRREVGQAGRSTHLASAAAWIAARYRAIARRVGRSVASIADPRDRDQPAAFATAETVRR